VPKSLKLLHRTSTSLLFSIEEVNNQRGYQLEYRIQGSEEQWLTSDGHELTNLKENSYYEVRAKSVNIGGEASKPS
jgi:hypothetical protein